MAEERLQKFLSECSVASRRKSEQLILEGRVYVNGKKASLGDKVNPKKDVVTVNGKKVNIPSYIVKVGDVVAVRDTKKDNKAIVNSLEANKLKAQKLNQQLHELENSLMVFNIETIPETYLIHSKYILIPF